MRLTSEELNMILITLFRIPRVRMSREYTDLYLSTPKMQRLKCMIGVLDFRIDPYQIGLAESHHKHAKETARRTW